MAHETLEGGKGRDIGGAALRADVECVAAARKDKDTQGSGCTGTALLLSAHRTQVKCLQDGAIDCVAH